MNRNNESEINNAFMQGLIGLAAVFYLFKNIIIEINQNVFIALIVFYVVLSMIRVFGIILDVESLKNISIDLFTIFGVPFTFFVALRILISELYPNIILFTIIPYYFFIMLFFYMLKFHFNLKIEITVNKRK